MDVPGPSSALFPRSAFAQRYLRVCEQLDALQPASLLHSLHQRGASDRDRGSGGGDASSRSVALPSRERIAELFATNERFRPADEVRALSSSAKSRDASSAPLVAQTATTATSRATPRVPTSPVSPAGARHVRRSVVATDASEAAKRDAKAQASAAVHVPVGGRARILPSQALQRAKAALRKRSNALANLQPATTSGLAPDKRRALHNAPESTWEVLRHASTPASGSTLSQQQQAPGKQALIAELVHKTHFSTQSIFQMSRKFKLIAGASKSVISFDEFRQIMSEDVGDLLVSIGVLGAAASSDGDDCDAAAAAASPAPQTPDMSAIGATISSSETFLRRLFLTFDVDGDGKIDFREFVVGLNGFVKGTPEEKVHALFEIYKSDDGSGDATETVAISDLLGLFQGDRHLYQELMRCVDEYFARVELRDELQPTMTEDEFVAASVAEPHLLDMVSRPVPSRRYASEAHVRDKVRTFIEHKQLNWKKLLAIHRRLVDSTRSLAAVAHRHRSSSALASPPATPRRDDSDGANGVEALAIPVAAFHEILSACLGSTPSGALDDEALTQSILLAYVATPREKLSTPQQSVRSTVATPSADDGFERRGSPVRRASIVEHYVAHVSCGELSQDIAVALQTALTAEHDAESKARYYFELYDQDGDGLLSRNELCTAICAGFGHFGQSMMDVVRALEDEDADQDGHVTKDEYMRAASKSPLILASLYTCLQREA